MLLGDTYLRHKKVIHDMEGQKIGLFPQSSSKSSHYIYQAGIMLPLLVVVGGVIAIFNFILQQRLHKEGEEEDDCYYELMRQRV